MRCECCGAEREKILHITVTDSAEKAMCRELELVPLCMECFLRYAGVVFYLKDVPDRWFE